MLSAREAAVCREPSWVAHCHNTRVQPGCRCVSGRRDNQATYKRLIPMTIDRILAKRFRALEHHVANPAFSLEASLAFGYCRCLRLSVRSCVRPSVPRPRACLRDNLSSVQARITKFGTEVQNTLVKIPFVWGSLTLNLKVKFNLNIKIYPILCLSTRQVATHWS